MDNVLKALPAVVIILAFLLIRLMRIFTAHQQKMTEILHRSTGDHAEISSLRQEIGELKALVHQQVIAADDRRVSTSPPPAPTVAERLNAGQ